MLTKEQLKELKPKYMHFYCGERPVLTVCKIKYEDYSACNYVGIGIAVCGNRVPNKKIMRGWAYHRAYQAFKNIEHTTSRLTHTEKSVINSSDLSSIGKEFLLDIGTNSMLLDVDISFARSNKKENK